MDYPQRKNRIEELMRQIQVQNDELIQTKKDWDLLSQKLENESRLLNNLMKELQELVRQQQQENYT